jgi:hypothetical protein
MWQVTGRFTIASYQTGDIDLTPVIGLALTILIVFLLGKTGGL